MMNIHQAAFAGRNERITQILADDPAQVNQLLELKEGHTVRKVTPIFLAVIAGQLETVKFLLNNKAVTECPEGEESLYDWVMLTCLTYDFCKFVFKINRPQNYFERITLNQFKVNRIGFESLLKNSGFERKLDAYCHNYYLWSGEMATVDQVQALLKDNPHEHACLAIALGALGSGNQPVLDYLKSAYGFNFLTRIQGGPCDGYSADMLAAHYGYAKVFPKLVEIGCQLNIPIPFGKNQGLTSLYLAGGTSKTILEFFKDCGFDLNATPQTGAFEGFSLSFVASGLNNLEVLEFLKENGCDLNNPVQSGPHEGMTPASIAANRGQVEALKYLKENGCDLNAPLLSGIHKGMTLAYVAAGAGQVEVLKFLKENGCDLNAAMLSHVCEGCTPAYFAAGTDQVEVLKYLEKEGCDLNAPLLSGANTGCTLAYTAAYHGQVNVLKYLKKKGCDFKVPMLLGNAAGQTLAYVAADQGQVDVLKYLKKKGCDLNTPILSGECAGKTLAYAAVNNDQLKVLQYLKSIGCKLNEPLSEGMLKGITPFKTAIIKACLPVMRFFYENGYEMSVLSQMPNGESLIFVLLKNNRIDVLNALQELGLDLDIPVGGEMPVNGKIAPGAVIPSKLPGVKKLTPKDRVALTYYQLQVHKSWFSTNKYRFFADMERISTEEWVQGKSWNEIHHLYEKYLELGGQYHQWLMNALVTLINDSTRLSKEEMDELFKNVDLKNVTIEQLNDAVKPGSLLLGLLERLSKEQVTYANDQLMHLEQWVSLLLQQKGGNEDFWKNSKEYFKEIRLKFKAKPTKAPSRGKGRGPQAKGDSFDPLWRKFDLKIKDAVLTSEELQSQITLKDQDLRKQFIPLSKAVSDCVEKLERKWKEVPIADLEDAVEKEYLDERTQKIQAFIDHLLLRKISEKTSLDQTRECFQKHDFRALNKKSILQDAVNAVGAKLLAEGKGKVDAALTHFSEMERKLESDLAALEGTKDFKMSQREMMQEAMFDSNLLPSKSLRKKVKVREAAVWQEHKEALAFAKTKEELQHIRQDTINKWNQVGQLLKPEKAVRSEKPARAQRIEDYKDQRIQSLKKENEQLLLEIERLKQSAQRPSTPEKIVPVVEAPLLNRLIKELEITALDSPSDAEALKMINKEGNILTKVTELVKFLALFQIDYGRTKGSHSTYTDGQAHVVIADHDGDSKDYQIKAALEAVLEKLKTKKDSHDEHTRSGIRR